MWRDVGAELSILGRERDEHNCPVPTVLPSMSFTLAPQQMQFVNVRNGFASRDSDGERLGGAQGSFHKEAAIIARLLAGYTNLEVELMHCVQVVRDDFDAVLKAMFRPRVGSRKTLTIFKCWCALGSPSFSKGYKAT